MWAKIMWPKLVFCIFLTVFPVAMVVAQDEDSGGPGGPGPRMVTAMIDGAGVPDGKTATAMPNGAGAAAPQTVTASSKESGDPDAKMVSGMSILGNKEAPMSLFIVPWKSSELGAETNLTRTLNERHVPVDREVFLRELAFYEVSAGSKGSALAAVSQHSNSR